MSLSDADFWHLIDSSREPAYADRAQRLDALVHLLRGLADEDLEQFKHRFDTFFARAYRSDLWEAGEIVNEGMGDDSFSDFRDWLISQGRDVYERVLEHPDNLLDISDGTSGPDDQRLGPRCDLRQLQPSRPRRASAVMPATAGRPGGTVPR